LVFESADGEAAWLAVSRWLLFSVGSRPPPPRRHISGFLLLFLVEKRN
jgi:hypothetical protein